MKRDSVVLEGFTGSKKIDDIIIKGVATFHDDTEDKARGNNSIYVINRGDLSFCHLGDLGHDLTGTMLTEILFPLTTSGRSTKFLPCNASSSTAIPLGDGRPASRPNMSRRFPKVMSSVSPKICHLSPANAVKEV